MANRDGVRFDNLHRQDATFIADSSIPFERGADYGSQHVGKAVKITGDGTVGLVADGNYVFGSLQRVEADGKAVVYWHGMVEFNTVVAEGSMIVGGAAGAIRAAVPGTDESAHGQVVSSNNGKSYVAL